ncbi:PIN domain-containing protein [Phosphitispora sp. TUW77]|uniref:PIN domain-containing protein n=1 Tax=Phosphitispora sp. TUW77 TaxID=3152361 RepID=UPI003AB2782D
MRILFDTNIILDILLKREPFFEASYDALKQAAANNTECLVSAAAVTDIFYLLRKGLGDTDKAKEYLERLMQLIIIADVLALDIQTALSDSIPNFEDAVVHAVAARNKVDYILTRNTKDFKDAAVPVITPQNFLKL